MTTVVALPHHSCPYLHAVGEDALLEPKFEADAPAQNTFSDCLNLAMTFCKQVEDHTESAYLTYQAKSAELSEVKARSQDVKKNIADLKAANDTTALNTNVISFIENHQLFIPNVYEVDDAGTGQWKIDTSKIGQEDLEKIASEFSNLSSRLTDMAGPELLHQQRMMQSLSLIYLTLNQIQVMANELMKTITQGLR